MASLYIQQIPTYIKKNKPCTISVVTCIGDPHGTISTKLRRTKPPYLYSATSSPNHFMGVCYFVAPTLQVYYIVESRIT